MRILILAQFYPPMIGGEERHVRNLSVALAKRGHTVTVATLQYSEDAAEFTYDEGVHIYRLSATMQRVSSLFRERERPHAPPFPDPEVLLKLHRIIEREQPDVIHAHNWIVHSFLPLKAWKHIPLVVTLHDYSLVCATKRLMYQQTTLCSGPALQKCWQCATAHYGALKGPSIMLANRFTGQREEKAVEMFLPVSQAVAEGTQLAHKKLPYKVIPNFIADDLASSCDPHHPLLAQLPPEDFLLFVGDLSCDKGVKILLQAYNRIQHKIPLVLIGRPVDTLFAEKPPDVHILQNWPHAAVLAAWQRSTLAIIPSIWSDPCPTVAMEAMCMGRPVIASRIGGLVDIVQDGETGVLVNPGDPVALQHSIDTLLYANEMREQMGKKGQQRIIEFQARTVIPRIEQVYQEVIVSRDHCNAALYKDINTYSVKK